MVPFCRKWFEHGCIFGTPCIWCYLAEWPKSSAHPFHLQCECFTGKHLVYAERCQCQVWLGWYPLSVRWEGGHQSVSHSPRRRTGGRCWAELDTWSPTGGATFRWVLVNWWENDLSHRTIFKSVIAKSLPHGLTVKYKVEWNKYFTFIKLKVLVTLYYIRLPRTCLVPTDKAGVSCTGSCSKCWTGILRPSVASHLTLCMLMVGCLCGTVCQARWRSWSLSPSLSRARSSHLLLVITGSKGWGENICGYRIRMDELDFLVHRMVSLFAGLDNPQLFPSYPWMILFYTLALERQVHPPSSFRIL